MHTTITAAMRRLLTAGQAAVRAAERWGSPETVAGLDKALCALPVLDMDDQASGLLHAALTTIALAEDAEEWELLTNVERTHSQLIVYPDGVTLEHPVVLAVGVLAWRCYALARDSGGVVARAWARGYSAGVEALGALCGAIQGTTDGRALHKAMTEFLTAVRRAIPYAALFATRRALVEFARTYELPIVGMRQPMPLGQWEYARRIGNAIYHFEVVPPLVENHPYGSVAVRRTAANGTAGPIRCFPFSSIDRLQAANDALYVL
ncbi:hypothetical protein ACLQ2N_32980 [Streptomyces sp. DT224]|uniref:hypothetical protein n=1 Tax=Streptomyces sp. DT224 TaxID=3393426 RepID=UPI003CEDDAFE